MTIGLRHSVGIGEPELGIEGKVVVGVDGWDGILVEVEAAGGDADRLPV